MEHEDAVGAMVGDSGTRKVEHVINGTMEYTYIDDELVLFIDRDPKYKLDLNAIKPEIAADNPYVELFLDEALALIDLSQPLRTPMKDMPSPTEEDLTSPAFNAIWDVIKTWDVNVPEHYQGYCGANGSHVMLILNALRELGR